MPDTKIPKHWRLVVSSDIIDIRDGTHDTPKYVKENGLPLITSKNLKENRVDFSNIKLISRVDHNEISKRSKVEEGDILFAMIGTIGNPAIIKGDTNFSIKNVGLFKKNEAVILPVFLVNFLRSNVFYKQLSVRKLLKGTTQRFIPLGGLRSINIPLPPLPEQHRIVSKIEELFSELDNGIANLKKAKDQLKVYRQSVLKWAFEGRLTEEWRKQNKPESAERLLEQIREEKDRSYLDQLEKWKLAAEAWEDGGKQGKKPAKPKKPNDFTPLTTKEIIKLKKLPTNWSYVKTGEIINPINNGYTPKANYLSAGSGEIPFIKVYNLNFDGSFNFQKNPTFIPEDIHKKNLKRSISYPEDVLINIVGPPLGKVSVVPDIFPEWNINQAIVMFRPNQFVSSKYLSYCLQNPVTIHWLENTSKATAGQFNVKVSTCREVPFPLCTINEQDQIVQEIESRLSVADNLKKTIDQSLKQSEALRQSILKRAFEGKLVPQDPNDEAAEVLLKRIKNKTLIDQKK